MVRLIKLALMCVAFAYGAAMFFTAKIETPPASAASSAAGKGQPQPPRPLPPAGVTLQADSRGHFTSRVSLNGTMIDALVDTGASMVALSAEDAERAGIRPSANAPKGVAKTANGDVPFTRVRINEIRLNGILVRDVEGAVMPKGALAGTLLGMSFLGKLSKVEMKPGQLVLAQ